MFMAPSSSSSKNESQARLRAEIIEHGKALSYDHVQRLPLLDAIVKEG